MIPSSTGGSTLVAALRSSALGFALRSSALGFALLLSSACSSPSTEEVGGETHWVKCSTNGDCKGARTCECGLCSTACDSDEDCKSLGATSVCALASESTQAAKCKPADAERLCLPEEAASNPSEPTGCDAPGIDAASHPECFSCFERLEAENQALSELATETRFLGCESDEDCGVVNIGSACAGRCGAVIGLEQAEAFEDAKVEVTAKYCDAPGFTPTCSQTPTCPVLEATCKDGLCGANTEVETVCPPEQNVVDGTCVGGMPTQATSQAAGLKYDEARGCFGEPSVAGVATCTQSDGIVAVAVGPDDQCWLLAPSCLPEGFAEATNDGPCAGLAPPQMCDCGENAQWVAQLGCMTCEEAYTAQVKARSTLLEAYSNATCEADEDCALVSTDLTCRTGCPAAVSQQDVEAVGTELSELSDAMCDGSAAAMSCQPPTPGCLAQIEAGCVDGTCQVRAAAPLQGSPFDEQGNCFLQPQDAGASLCQDGPPVISYARDPSGTCWMFPSGCIPDGFMRVEAGAEPCSSTSDACEPAPFGCNDASIEECSTVEGCVLARAHEQLDSCFAPTFTDLLCVPDPGGCGDAETMAVDGAGACWLFPTTCVPEGFTSAEPDQCPAEPVLCDAQ